MSTALQPTRRRKDDTLQIRHDVLHGIRKFLFEAHAFNSKFIATIQRGKQT